MGDGSFVPVKRPAGAIIRNPLRQHGLMFEKDDQSHEAEICVLSKTGLLVISEDGLREIGPLCHLRTCSILPTDDNGPGTSCDAWKIIIPATRLRSVWYTKCDKALEIESPDTTKIPNCV
jgi:hypothetical protein